MPNQYKILIIDDSLTDAQYFKMRLKRLSAYEFEIKHKSSKDAAFDYLRKESPDFIFVDYMLGLDNGVEVIKEILEFRPEALLVLQTGFGSEDVVTEALRAGAKDYISKGDTDQETLQRVIYHLENLLESQKEIQREKSRYKDLVESLNDMIIRFDKKGRITFVNSAFLKEFDFEFEHIHNKIFFKLTKEFRLDGIKSILQDLNNSPYKFELKHQKIIDDTLKWYEWEIKAIIHDRKISEYQAVGRDISARKVNEKFMQDNNKQLEEIVDSRTKELEITKIELEKALKEEKELSRIKNKFIDNISHEYRTPLTIILSSASLMYSKLGKENNEKTTNHYNKIQKSVNYLTKLIENVLTFQQSQNNELKANIINLNLDLIINQVAKKYYALEKKVNFDYDNSKINFDTDPKLLEIVLDNIISNAYNFSPELGTITIKSKENDKEVKILIEDEGPGISESDLKFIFDPFFKEEKNIGLKKGNGIGLTIVKKCIDILHGRIEIKNKAESGLFVELTFPK